MSCSPTKNLDFHLRGGRWCWTLKRDQKRSRAGRWSWAQKVGLRLLQLFLNSSATDIGLVTLLRIAVETAIAKYTNCYAMAKEYCLNTFVVMAAVHGLLGLPVWSARSRLHSLTRVISKYTFLNSSHIYINPLSSQSTKPVTSQIQNIHTQTSDTNFRRVSPFGITPVKTAHKARTCWYRRPFRLIYRYQVKENYRKGIDRRNIK